MREASYILGRCRQRSTTTCGIRYELIKSVDSRHFCHCGRRLYLTVGPIGPVAENSEDVIGVGIGDKSEQVTVNRSSRNRRAYLETVEMCIRLLVTVPVHSFSASTLLDG